MKILDKIDFRLLKENEEKCSVFWCIPIPTDDGFTWELEKFDDADDNLDNWSIISHKLKHIWNKDTDPCLEKCYSLPRCLLYKNKLYHGNNLPIDFDKIIPDIGVKIKPIFNNRFIIKKDDLLELEKCLDVNLNLEYTEI